MNQSLPHRQYLNNVFANTTLVAHPEGPANEEDTRENNLGRKFIPPWADVLGVADEEGPLAMVFNVEIVVDTKCGKT
jgi:hypothetical protein